MANNLLGARAKLVNIRAGIKQRGVTLLELIAGLAVMAVIVVGALALFNAANTAQRGTQLTQDITALRSAVTQLWMGQGTFSTGSLNVPLIASGRIPATLRATGNVLNHPTGTIDVVGGGSSFHLVVTGLPQSVCMDVLTSATGWSGVRIAQPATPPAQGTQLIGGVTRTMPISPVDAASACTGTTNNNAIQFTGS